MHVIRALFATLLTAMLVLQPAGALARSEFYCQMMGRVVASCCCASEAAVELAPAPEWQGGDCCQRLSAKTALVPLTVHESLPGVPAAALLKTVVLSTPSKGAQLGQSACTPSTEAPLAIGPPLFVIHCALLS